MGNDDDPAQGTPKIFQRQHQRLRGGKKDGSWMCGGSDNEFKIKKGLRFGREYTTDVLEVVLNSQDGEPLVDSTIAFTLAVALRRAIAESLGIEESELGCDTKMLRDDFGRKARAIQIFDIRSAGYSSLVAPELPGLLRMARKNLQCKAECDGACQMCLLTFDTRYRTDDLNRQAALGFMTDAWLDSVALDAKHQLLGVVSKPEYQAINEAIFRELNRGDAKRLLVYLNGSVPEWDLPASPLRRMLHRLSAREDLSISLVTPTTDLGLLSPENAAVIRSLQTLGEVSLKAGTPPGLSGPGYCFATIERQDGTYTTWATNDNHAALCDRHWGQLSDGIVIFAPTSNQQISDQSIFLPSSEIAGVQLFEITNELNGHGAGFGDRFWKHLAHDDLSALFHKGAIPTSIEYEDRYLSTPVSCALLLDVLSSIKSHFQSQNDWGEVPVRVITMAIDEGRSVRNRSNWWSDWETTVKRDQSLEAAFNYSGISASVLSTDKRNLSHGRRLTVRFHNGGYLVVWLDQGWSYWTISKTHRHTAYTTFSMALPTNTLGETLADFRVDVQGHDLPTQVFVDTRHLR